MNVSVGDKVVYPNQGVALVVEKVEKKFSGVRTEFYVLEMLGNQSTVMVPCDNLEQVGLRKLSGHADVEQLFGLLEGDFDGPESDWKQRHQKNVQSMLSGDLLKAGEVLKELCALREKKKLGLRDQKMMEQAKNFVVSEVAAVESLEEEEALAKVLELLGVPEEEYS